MKKVKLFSENQIKQASIIELNADSKLLSKVIIDVQKLVLRPVLGDQLYNQVIDEVELSVTDTAHEMNPTIKVLLDEYIKDFFISAVVQDWIVTNNYKMTNKGMVKSTDSNASSLTSDELEYAKNYYDNKVSAYKLNLINYLKSQKLIDNNTDQDVTSESTGWYMDDDFESTTSTFVPAIPEGSSGPVSWEEIENKPIDFLPSPHTHTYSTITDKPTEFTPSAHTHTYDSITGKPSVFAAAPHTHTYDSITDKPTEFTPVAHTHSYDSITGKPTSFTPSTHTHAIADVTNLQSSLNAKADLVGGFVPSSQLPSFVDDVIEAATFSALPVTGETGKMYVTINNNKVYRWSGSTYIQIVASPGSTDEVPEGSVNKYFTDSRAITALSSALSGKANTSHVHAVSDITDLSSYTGFDSRYFTETEVSTLINSKANSAHTHAASDINSGVFNTARLGTGTASSSTYLRGDGTWATVSAGGTQDLTTTLGYGNLGTNWMRLTSDSNTSFGPYTPTLELVSTNYPGALIKDTGGYGHFIGMGADKRLRFLPTGLSSAYNESINFGVSGVANGVDIANNFAGTGITMTNLQSGGKSWNIMSVGSGYGAPLGSISFYGGDAGYAFTMTKEGNVSIGTGSPIAGYRLDVNGDLAIGSILGTRGASDLVFKSNSVVVGRFDYNQSSVAFGTLAVAGFLGVSIGYTATSGNQGVAVGRGTYAATAATGVGYNARAEGSYSTAIGAGSKSTHDYSTIINDGYSYDGMGGTYITSDATRQFKAVFLNGYKFNSLNATTLFEILADGKIKMSSATPTYPDNAAAIAGGLTSNTLYKTPTGDVKIVL